MEFLKNQNKQNMIGVEIGVHRASNAENFLNGLDIKKLYLVDIFDNHFIEQLARKNLKKYDPKTVFIKDTSENAVKDIPANLDFVYIDGNHKYRFVKKDIELYYPKVCNGGVIGGHDINTLSVFVSCILFALKKRLISSFHILNPDWWVVKNGKK